MPEPQINLDAREIARFDALAVRWWDPQGELRTLHAINALRLHYIEARTALRSQRVLDVGCGGGLLAEAMAARGADVTGIDMADEPLTVARLHQHESGLQVTYLKSSAEALAAESPGHFAVVTCMEMLEHVPAPAAVVQACAALAAPGAAVFFSTLNRTPKAFVFAILGAEYVLRLLPRGTHAYQKFIRPAELDRWARAAGLELRDSIGLHYNPLTREYHLGGDVGVNYFLHYERPA
ncbi:MAG: bifunctional 2-polyprenyl-6-hydroxyphenol methylase/3-demethylubiquinol 3-O-methyltransferase UbiG [Gammaproteobacteria bacterium]